ncbi:hypothetical protein CCACVL1_15830 [Corchorus capsularis]|uniref:Uncharacterized protein n=1 Tax=Corchorus capsularis TaxID=210143 RepID=A0A1R3I0V2_COCAP|nr:hypothetical protein CCACVL1_15830 [Corchorus capsularis]
MTEGKEMLEEEDQKRMRVESFEEELQAENLSAVSSGGQKCSSFDLNEEASSEEDYDIDNIANYKEGDDEASVDEDNEKRAEESSIICQSNRQIQGRDDFRRMLQQVSPRQHFRMENGGIVLTARSESLENNIISPTSLFQRSLDLKATFPIRHQPNSFMSKARGQENGFPKLPGLHNIQGQQSNQIHGILMDTAMIRSIGPMRSGRFLEEKRWRPFKMLSNRWKVNATMGKLDTFGNTYSSTRPTEQANMGQFVSNKHDLQSKFNSCRPEFESSLWFELNRDKVLKDREWLPDLQLRIGIDQDKAHCKGTQEISTQLTLS